MNHNMNHVRKLFFCECCNEKREKEDPLSYKHTTASHRLYPAELFFTWQYKVLFLTKSNQEPTAKEVSYIKLRFFKSHG